jgi:hypothetical protein
MAGFGCHSKDATALPGDADAGPRKRSHISKTNVFEISHIRHQKISVYRLFLFQKYVSKYTVSKLVRLLSFETCLLEAPELLSKQLTLSPISLMHQGAQ